MVIKQKTAAETKVPKGATIQVIVSSGKAEEITIPDVSGMEEDEAKQKLKDAGFKNVDSAYEYSGTVPEGQVFETDPAIGTKATAETKVTVKVSKGTEMVTVPSIVGLSDQEAQAKLSSVGLKGAPTSSNSATVPAGQVMSQNPYAGNKVETGTVVSYVVSKGQEEVVVPGLNGSTEVQAVKALKNAGLKGTCLGYRYDDSAPAGTIIDQKPAAGESVTAGSTVTYYLSNGPDPSKDDSEDDSEGQ